MSRRLQFLSADGAGGGQINAVLDYATTPGRVYVAPPAKRRYQILGLAVAIEDGTAPTAVLYGGLAALTNGITIRKLKGAAVLEDYTRGVPIRKNADFAHQGWTYTVPHNATASLVRASIRFDGVPLVLEGDQGHELSVAFADSLVGLVQHYWTADLVEIKTP